MSIRSLIEINHDAAGRWGGEDFLDALDRFVCSASRETADALEPYGLKVIGQRHHSGFFILDGEPDGFPVQYLPPRKIGGVE